MDLLGESRVGFLEVQVARRLQEPPRRPDIKSHLFRPALTRQPNRGSRQFIQRMNTMVLETVRAERIGHDDLRPSLGIGAVNGRDRRRILHIPVRRIFPRGKSGRLNHRTKTTVKYRHLTTSQMAVTDFDGKSRSESVSVTPTLCAASSRSRISRLRESGIFP